MATETYRFSGSKRLGDRTSSLRLQDGTVLVKGGDAQPVSEEELESLRAAGYKLTKAEASSDDSGDSNDPKTPAQQQVAQVASGAQHGALSSSKDNTPQGRALRNDK